MDLIAKTNKIAPTTISKHVDSIYKENVKTVNVNLCIQNFVIQGIIAMINKNVKCIIQKTLITT